MKLSAIHTIARLTVILVSAMWAISNRVYAADFICYTSGIKGFEEVAETAKNYIGKNTKELSETKIYVTVENGHLYMHSNYKTGKKDEIIFFPTKYITDNLKLDLKGYTYDKIVGPIDVSEVSPSTFNRHFHDMEFYVDQKLFTDPKFSKLALGDASIKIIDRDGIPHFTEIVPNAGNQRMVEMDSGVYARLTPEGGCNIAEHVSILWDIADLIGEAESKRLNPDNVKTDISDKRVVEAKKQDTYGEFFSELRSFSFTLVDLACKARAEKSKLTLTIYEKPSATDIVSAIVDKLGNIEITLDDSNKKPNPSASTTQAEPKNNGPCGLGFVLIIALVWLYGASSKVKGRQ